MKRLLFIITILGTLCATFSGCTEDDTTPVTPGGNNNEKPDNKPVTPNDSLPPIAIGDIALGADISWLTEMEDEGRTFYSADGKESECTALLKDLGLNAIRLSVLVNPADGYCNKEDVLKKALRAKELDMKLMIAFHYSDTHATVDNHNLPLEWTYQTDSATVCNNVQSHTREVLETLAENGISPEWVQIGNEVTYGLLSPVGSISNSPKMYSALIDAGCKAAKEICPQAKTIVHITEGYDMGLFKWNLDILKADSIGYDMVGISIYPYLAQNKSWTNPQNGASQTIGTVEDAITATFDNCKFVWEKYKKQTIIVETAMKADYPEGGKKFLSQLLNEASNSLYCKGVFYYEPQAHYGWNGYKYGAFNQDGTPSDIMDAYKNRQK